MRAKHYPKLCLFPAVCVVLLLLCPAASAQNATDIPELPHLLQVDDRLYRGGQPREGGLLRLRELGIDTIINLRGGSKDTRAEGDRAQELGINYFNIALPNWGRPQNERVRRILLIIGAPQSGRVFVHCKDGVDRTGTIVALHRMIHEGWNSHDALKEAEQLGMRRIQFWMRDYAEDYGEQAQDGAFEKDFDDRIGDGMRMFEWGVFKARKLSGRLRAALWR